MNPVLDHPYALELDEASLAYDGRPILDRCSLRVPRGHTKVILGASGAGKSTILRLALGLVRPDRGRVSVFGRDITGRLAPARTHPSTRANRRATTMGKNRGSHRPCARPDSALR